MPSLAPDSLFLDFQEALAGRYSLDREVGRGGMGIVYLAREVHLDRPVAIKLLPPELATSPKFREAFLREARLAARLSHPNIIPIHSVEESDAFVFYVMAFVDGETLTERVRTRGPLSASDGARMLRDVSWALGFAHAQGLVHRDVKPDNILIEHATGRVLVADFGIAAAFSDTGPNTTIAGTPEFMSPEQALGDALDARSDIYSLGATAFFALSGRLPFTGDTSTEVLAKQVTENAPALATAGIAAPRKLAALIDRCLAKDPKQRPQDVQQLGEQLGLALEQRREMPVALRAFVKRHGRLDGGGTMVFGFMLLPGSTWASAALGAEWGALALIGGATVLPGAYLVTMARRLARMGFAHQDLGPAFKAEIERACEELQIANADTRPTRLERVFRGITRLTLPVLPLAWASVLVGGARMLQVLGPAPFIIGSSGVVAGLGWLALAQRRSDVDTAFWGRLWNGRIGRTLFGIARRTLGRSMPAAAMTHRATELSLGLAAEQLFESLPRETREALGNLPIVLKRLGEDATSLRARHNEISEALAAGGEASSGAACAEVRATRDQLHARLGDVVSSMETIRLQLLRLHAGTATVQSVTTHLGLAADVSDEVQRLIEAHAEVDRVLGPTLTPTPA